MNNQFSWYEITSDDQWAYLNLRNKKGANRKIGKRRLADVQELKELKSRLEDRKERMDKIIASAIAEAIRLAKENPEEFHRRFNKSRGTNEQVESS